MPLEAIIILILAVGTLVGLGLWLGLTATKAQLPAGADVTGIFAGPHGTVTVILRRPAGALIDQAGAWAKHVYAAAQAWGESGRAGTVKEAMDACKTVRILLLDDKTFDNWDLSGLYIDRSVAFQTFTPQRVGSGAPLLVIRDRMTQAEKDSLVIHESLHLFAGKNNLTVEENHHHKDERVWGTSSESTIEARATKLVQELA